MKKVTMVVPAFAETEVTGFVIAFEIVHRGKLYRCEIHRYTPNVRCSKEGNSIAWESLPSGLRKSVHAWNNSRKGINQ